MVTLPEWLKEQFAYNPDINQTSLALTIKVSQSTVSKWLGGVAVPDPENCYKLAAYFHVPPEQVLALAGHLQPNPSALAESRNPYSTQPPGLGEAIHLFRALTDDDQERILAIMRTFVNEQRRAHNHKPVPSRAPPG